MTAQVRGSKSRAEPFCASTHELFFLNMDVHMNLNGIMLCLGLGLGLERLRTLLEGRCSSVKCCHDSESQVDARGADA
jgi:hypothetical protein